MADDYGEAGAVMTTDDELIDAMWRTWTAHATPKPFLVREAMRAVLAVVRAHDNGRAVVIRVDPEKEKLVRSAIDAAKGEG